MGLKREPDGGQGIRNRQARTDEPIYVVLRVPAKYAGNREAICEELGDLLRCHGLRLDVVSANEFADSAKLLRLEEVAEKLLDKLIACKVAGLSVEHARDEVLAALRERLGT